MNSSRLQTSNSPQHRRRVKKVKRRGFIPDAKLLLTPVIIKCKIRGTGKSFGVWYLSEMLEQFLNHIGKHALIREKDKILLALSGGKDSTAMFDLFRRGGFDIGVAHCNFALRGEESDRDAEFVKDLAGRQGIPYFETKVDTLRHAEDKGISVQMAARDIRYRWFAEIMAANGFTLTATAHHLNDALETVLLNLVRGTGIDGLAGIAVRQHMIIRPMLFASRADIDRYVQERELPWREDASNATDDYQRNLIRHRIVPVLRELNPGLDSTFRNTLSRLRAAKDFFHHYLRDFSLRNITYDGRHVFIRKKEITTTASGGEILYELLKDLGFQYDQCVTIHEGQHQTGAVFASPTHQLTVDRTRFILGKISHRSGVSISIAGGTSQAVADGRSLRFAFLNSGDATVTADQNVAFLDADTLHFPLLWRDWEEGDRFVPLGMTTNKKVSDFLVDQKVPRPMKEQITVLTSEGEIVWVVGIRIADPFKITGRTSRVCMITAADPA